MEEQNETMVASPIMKYFAYSHLPKGDLQNISAYCSDTADHMDFLLPGGAEKSAGLRKLLEAKDCFVRAALEIKDAEH